MWIRQNQLEQDEIAKAEMHNPFRKLPKPLMDKIRWCALEPTPTAKIMKDVTVLWRVFPHSDFSPYGPGIIVFLNVVLRVGCATFREFNDPSDPSDPSINGFWRRRREMVIAINDVPLDTEPVGHWQCHGDGELPIWAAA